MKRVQSVGILGAGRIAQGFDKPGDSHILTLAHAVTRCPRLCLGGFYDCCLTATRKAERKWKTPPSPRNREEWLGAGWDIICIATPDNSHAKDLSDVLNHSPRAILVEKPLTQEDRIGQKLLRKAGKLGIPVLVDFPRRWHKGAGKAGRMLDKGDLGRVLKIQATFSGGLRHNGIHALDLVAQWCSPVRATRKLHAINNGTILELRAASGPIILQINQTVLTDSYQFEVSVECEFGRITMASIPEQLTVECVRPHEHFGGFNALQLDKTWVMDDEPLLLNAIKYLGGLIGKPAAIRAQLDFEIERHRFFAQVFRVAGL